jgi:hypothetical protein
MIARFVGVRRATDAVVIWLEIALHRKVKWPLGLQFEYRQEGTLSRKQGQGHTPSNPYHDPSPNEVIFLSLLDG